MKKLALLVAVLGIAALAPAPIREAPPPGTPILPHHTDEQLTEEQKNQKVQGEVGSVPQVTDRPEVTSESAAPDAAKTLQQAESTQVAEATLKKAGKELEEKSGGLPVVFWAVLFAALGFGGVYGVRYWVAKNIPLPGDSKHRVTW